MDIQILNNIIIILKILGLAWFINGFEPLYWILDTIQVEIHQKRIISHLIINILNVILSCFKCCSFWIGLIFFQSIWLALISSYIAFIINKLTLKNKFKNNAETN